MSSNPHNVILLFHCGNLTWHQALIWVILVYRFTLEMLDHSTVCITNKAPFCDPVDPYGKENWRSGHEDINQTRWFKAWMQD